MTHSNMWPRGNWVRTHLNWTVMLWWLLIIPLAWITITLYSITESETTFILYGILSTIWFIGFWYFLIWNLKHKGRRLWNLLYLLIPFGIGFIVFLCISNKEQLAKENAEREERERYAEEYWRKVEENKLKAGQEKDTNVQ